MVCRNCSGLAACQSRRYTPRIMGWYLQAIYERNDYMRRTKIVCTIGPATNSEERLEALMRAGMNVARLNFSHGKQEEHAVVIERIRALSKRLNCAVAILQA